MSRVPAIPEDDEIVAAIQMPVESATSSAKARCVALLNRTGQPYRLVMTRGDVEFYALRERLDWLAFEPRAAASGFDAVFARDDPDDFPPTVQMPLGFAGTVSPGEVNSRWSALHPA